MTDNRKKHICRPSLRHTASAVLAGMALMLCACSDYETFTTSPYDRLTFSADTISLDTVFSQVPSSTRAFWVYNKNKDAVRCTNIKLGKGNQTGFRVNVNGISLGESQGYQIFDEDIFGGDSIRVYVELTSPENGGREPLLVKDDLVFTLESGERQSIELKAWSWDANLLTNPVIENDMVLDTSSPTVIYGSLMVKEGACLTLPPGATLYMHDKAVIDVFGRLICNGEKDNEVTIRGDRLDRMFDYLPYDGVSGQWGGILLHESSYGNVIRFTDIHAATDAIVCDSADTARQKLTLSHSTVHNNKGYGIKADNCRLTIENSLISNTLSDCVALYGGIATINNTTIAQFYPFDANRGFGLSLTDRMNGTPRGIPSLHVTNSILTGYGENCLGISIPDSVETDCRFDHCLLRTQKTYVDTTKVTACIYEEAGDTTSAGWKNFAKVDTALLQYDFSLSETSAAIDAADKATSLPDDRKGEPRDDKPDMGCFELKRESEKQ